MAEKESMSEGLPARLVRVVRKIKRRSRDGRILEYERTFNVKQAAPGDRYVSTGADGAQAQVPMPTQQQQQAQQSQQQSQQPAEPAPQPQEPPPPTMRIGVRVLDVPWEIGANNGLRRGDPIPPAVRLRFDPKNRASRAQNPLMKNSPISSVIPGEKMMWDIVEPELIDRLRSGRIMKVRFGGGKSGTLWAKVEGRDGYIHQAFMKFELLIDPYVYEVWGDLYDIKRENGDLSRRAAAAYEFSKAAGMDDLIPPTIARMEEIGSMDPILPPDLMERQGMVTESIARLSGEKVDDVKKKVGGFVSLQLCIDGVHTVDQEDWVAPMFKAGSDTLNHPFDSIPKERRAAILRTAVLDFLLWTADRPLASMGFSNNEKHPVILLDNELCLPDPRAMILTAMHGGEEYTTPPVDPDAYPMLWSDPALMVALRGGDAELADYENIAIETLRRIRDKGKDLVRCLIEHQIPKINVAGLLVRAEMLWTMSRKVARNPYLAVTLMGELSSGKVVPGGLLEQMPDIVDRVNKYMSTVGVGDFDLLKEMKVEVEDENN